MLTPSWYILRNKAISQTSYRKHNFNVVAAPLSVSCITEDPSATVMFLLLLFVYSNGYFFSDTSFPLAQVTDVSSGSMVAHMFLHSI